MAAFELPPQRLLVRGWPLRLTLVADSVFVWHDKHAKLALLLIETTSYTLAWPTVPQRILDDVVAIARAVQAQAQAKPPAGSASGGATSSSSVPVDIRTVPSNLPTGFLQDGSAVPGPPVGSHGTSPVHTAPSVRRTSKGAMQ